MGNAWMKKSEFLEKEAKLKPRTTRLILTVSLTSQLPRYLLNNLFFPFIRTLIN